MKIKRFTEEVLDEFKARANSHQLHLEDLVLLGRDGLEELNDKIDKFIRKLESNTNELNMTTKVDGCLHPDTLIATTEGDMTFSKIIKDYNCGIEHFGYGYNDKTGNIEIIKLNLPRVKNGNKDWCSVEFDNGGYFVATIDHPVKVGNDYIDAIDLKIGTKIDGIEQF